ncbi:MAG: manganese efflux pump MntP family protein, partial [Lachnospiraceae bacterium]|nr:manganese efflux pump MntP family protein [Lachnospiraceae bacterium]
EAVCPDGEKEEYVHLSMGTLLVQGIATSIDALSVGFTIADYGAAAALVCSLLIGAVTLVICLAGLELGKKAGTKLSGKADILGGTILILIGLEIFIKRMIL